MGGIFKAYDIRGQYPDEVDEQVAFKIGRAFVELLRARRVVVGHDMRVSSPSLAHAFIEGATTGGAEVTSIGLSTTPKLYFAIADGNYDGGAMVTASHLPGQSNGFKLCREKAIPLSGDEGLPALELMVADMPDLKGPIAAGAFKEKDVLDRYLSVLRTSVRTPKSLKAVIDAGNGSIGPEVIPFTESFPMWEVVPLYMEPDGTFPNHEANPLIPKNTEELQARVVQERADIGIAFDGDADRCGFVDEKGQRIPEDLVTALIAEVFLSRQPGATILYDLRSSRTVPETISRLGGKPIRSRVGHAFIKAQMREFDAVFAGELSGHYYYKDTGFTDNGLFTMIQMLNFLSLKEKPLSSLIAPLRKYSATGEINMHISDKDAIFTALEGRFADGRQDSLDGLSVDYDRWWFNVRASNTEPVIRLNLEADTPALMEEKRKEVLDTIQKADPGVVVQKGE